MKTTMLTGALILTAGLITGLAQETRNFEYQRIDTVTGTPAQVVGMAAPGMFFFEHSEMAFDGSTVKGAPYAADAVTETTQTLTDGNRIHRTTKSSLFRDSEGRTRREQSLGAMGPMMASGEPIQTVVISDPVAGTTYMLDARQKTAHKMPAKAGMMMMSGGNVAVQAKLKAEHDHVAAGAVGGPSFAIRINQSGVEGDPKNLKKESLGTQMMEGVAADGTRTTLTIPAGAMGNERPIDVVTEQWYSKQLQTMVMTKTTDPRMGETVYKLTNVKLDEPAASLFTVPADYQLIDPSSR